MTTALIDTHAHLDNDSLRADWAGMLNRASEAGVVQIIGVGTTADDSVRLQESAIHHQQIFATAGIHPNHVLESQPGDWDRIVALLNQPKVVAVGETGLDRYWKTVPFPDQQRFFDLHLQIARERNLPVIIHCRECEQDIIDQLQAFGPPIHGVLHSFTGTIDHARAFLNLGLHISFAGQVTFANKNLDSLRTAAAFIPLDRILVETDSPYLSPHPHRGKPNEPARVRHTAEKIAEIRALPFQDFAAITTQNARRLFRLPNGQNVEGVMT